MTTALEAKAKYDALIVQLTRMEQNLLAMLLVDTHHTELPKAAAVYREAVRAVAEARERLHAKFPALALGPGLPHPGPKTRRPSHHTSHPTGD